MGIQIINDSINHRQSYVNITRSLFWRGGDQEQIVLMSREWSWTRISEQNILLYLHYITIFQIIAKRRGWGFVLVQYTLTEPTVSYGTKLVRGYTVFHADRTNSEVYIIDYKNVSTLNQALLSFFFTVMFSGKRLFLNINVISRFKKRCTAANKNVCVQRYVRI